MRMLVGLGVPLENCRSNGTRNNDDALGHTNAHHAIWKEQWMEHQKCPKSSTDSEKKATNNRQKANWQLTVAVECSFCLVQKEYGLKLCKTSDWTI